MGQVLLPASRNPVLNRRSGPPWHRVCEVCKSPFETSIHPKKTCSSACSEENRRRVDRSRRERGPSSHPRLVNLANRCCIQCGIEFSPTSGRQKSCQSCRGSVRRDQTQLPRGVVPIDGFDGYFISLEGLIYSMKGRAIRAIKVSDEGTVTLYQAGRGYVRRVKLLLKTTFPQSSN
jgi:hypothetical protein